LPGVGAAFFQSHFCGPLRTANGGQQRLVLFQPGLVQQGIKIIRPIYILCFLPSSPGFMQIPLQAKITGGLN
jgi:hypothetical protein